MDRLRVLIIDDNKDLIDGLADLFELEGHEATVVYSGRQGIAQFLANDYDFTLLDIKLPDLSGIEVFRQIHKQKRNETIFFMTGFRITQLLEEVVGKDKVVTLRGFFLRTIFYGSSTRLDRKGFC